MKKYILYLFLTVFVFISEAKAQAQVSYAEEAKALGAIAGQGMSCGAEMYETYEMLARAILITKASSDYMQEQGMRIYSEEKANTFVSKQFDGGYDCASIKRRFNNQDIFNITLYSDGTIKMPDGQIFTPRTPYDVTLVYQKGGKDVDSAKAIYGGAKDNVKNAQISAQGIDTPKAVVQQPVYETGTVTPQGAQPLESSLGHISRKKKR